MKQLTELEEMVGREVERIAYVGICKQDPVIMFKDAYLVLGFGGTSEDFYVTASKYPLDPEDLHRLGLVSKAELTKLERAAEAEAKARRQVSA